MKNKRLIGISGESEFLNKLVADTLQYLTQERKGKPISEQMSLTQFLIKRKNFFEVNTPNYEIKYFFDIVKKIGSDALNLPIKEFDSRNVLESKTNKKWWSKNYFEDSITGIIYKVPFDSSDKSDILFDVDKPSISEFLYSIESALIERVHPNFLINTLFSNFDQQSKWVIPDVELDNEVEAIKKRNGILIRLVGKRTSNEWQLEFDKVKVLDPDGWDRQNYDYSWYEERISLDEYKKRVLRSTCLGDFKTINYPDFDYVIEYSDMEFKDIIDNVKQIKQKIFKDGNLE